MRAVLLAALALWANLTPAHAELGLDSVRNQLVTHDFAALEQDFAAAHVKARDSGDSSLLRQINGTLFFTVNDARLGQLRNWQAAYPASPYAATALAWTQYRRGFAQRGTNFPQDVAPQSMIAYRLAMDEAEHLAQIALTAGLDYRPVLDLSLLLDRAGHGPLPAYALLAQSQKLGPDYRSLYLGLLAHEPNWGGSVEQMMSLCDKYADAIPDYDRELCQHEVLFWVSDVPALMESLDTITATRRPRAIDPTLRFAYTTEWAWQNRPEALDELKRLMTASLDCETDFYRFQNEIFAIWSNYADGAAIASDITRQYFRVTKDCLKDSPQDPNLLASIIGFAYGAEVPEPELSQARAMAEAAWQESLKLGETLPATWKAGRQIARNRMVDGAKGWWDYPAMERYYRNEIAYSANNMRVLHEYRSHLNFLRVEGARLDPSSAEAKLLARDGVTQALLACRIWRAKRLYDVACDQQWGKDECSRVISADNAREAEFLANGPLCPWERFAPVDALLEAPLPASEFVSASQ
ncbi:DUF4034 domain-containing protein [Gemmobacter serpentinus]|uniref:DUF4034 domain-containing protein n=1 Tax=Gemmobacter serpentinus TaxID=2652247 RepID=UPI0018657FB6|nr:DUF4034 domain-containing protein [Gemmobacter serpentinus]